MVEGIQDEARNRVLGKNEVLGVVQDKISVLQGEILAEKKNREECYDELIKRLGGHVLRVNNLVINEKKNREET